MGYIGVSIIVASAIFVVFCPPPPLVALLRSWRQRWSLPAPPDKSSPRDHAGKPSADATHSAPDIVVEEPALSHVDISAPVPPIGTDSNNAQRKAALDRQAMPPPPPPLLRRPNAPPPAPIIKPPTQLPNTSTESDEQTTPKAAATGLDGPVPAFSLSAPASPPSPASPSQPASSTRLTGRVPTLAAFPALNSVQRARPAPNRGPPAPSPSSSSLTTPSLAPPPTHTTKPSKPSRKVILTPGHSPLDWAGISGPNADLRGLPADTPYLRVTPTMLKRQTGRRGKDAWSAINGKVYNLSPYLPYHPGGEPELLRAAGRDGTRLFGEIHPWVNYETMLAACLVGILVEEAEVSRESEMERMD